MKTFSKAFALFLLFVLESGAQTLQPLGEPPEEPATPAINSVDTENRMMARHRGGNGGDSIAAQFTTIAHNAAAAWEAQCLENQASLCEYLEEYKAQLDKQSPEFVKVLSAPSVYADDNKKREAVNFVDQNNVPHIIVSEEDWLAIERDSIGSAYRKINLVLHEYFSLMGLESGDYYNKSRELFSIFQNNRFDLERMASKNHLPSKCSMYLEQNETIGSSLYRDLKIHMGQQNYPLTRTSYEARFVASMRLTCSGSFINRVCAVYVEVVDTFKNRELFYSKHLTDNRFGRKKTLINKLFSQALDDIPYCE